MHILALILLAGPFYLNDFSSIYLESWRWWLFIDYTAVKLFPLLVALWLMRSSEISAANFGLRPQALPSFMAIFLVVTLAGFLIDQNGYALLAGLPGYAQLGGMPPIADPVWDWLDLTFGLFMVEFSRNWCFAGICAHFSSPLPEVPWRSRSGARPFSK